MRLVDITKAYIDKPFKHEGIGDGGWSCVGLCHNMLTKLGKNIISEYKGRSITNYLAWENSVPVSEVDSLLREAFDSVGREVSVKDMIPGDFLLIEMRGRPQLAVYVGNGNAISAFLNTGVLVFRLDRFVGKYTKVRRV